jgi:ABC-2 type transport system permease protein
MSAFWYGVALQWRLDIRSRTMLITCYVVPLLFFAIMGGIFTSILPEATDTLIPSMTVMGVSMGALIGLPPTLVEIYASGIRKIYRANGVPLYLGLVSSWLSSFLHLMLMSAIIYATAPVLFGAALPANPLVYWATLALFVMVSLGVGGCLGLAVKSQAKLTMYSQMIFLPSIMLSGIMFSAALLPRFLRAVGMLFPASWGFRLMVDGGAALGNLWPLLLILAASILLCHLLLRRLQAE